MPSYLDSDSWQTIYHQPEKGYFFSLFTPYAYADFTEREEADHILLAIAFLSALGLHSEWQKCSYWRFWAFLL